MKKIISGISLVLVILLPKMAISQQAFISLGAEIAFPAANYQETGKSGIGGSIQMEHPWSKHVSGILSIDYIKYSNHEFYPGYNEQFSVIPVQFGIKYYTTAAKNYPSGFYLSGLLGITAEFYHVVLNFENNGGTYDQNEKYPGFCSTVGMGYQLGIADAGFRFQTIYSSNSGITNYYHFRLAFTIR